MASQQWRCHSINLLEKLRTPMAKEQAGLLKPQKLANFQNMHSIPELLDDDKRRYANPITNSYTS